MSLVTTRVGLVHRMTTQRVSSGDDAGGGSNPTWTDHLSDVPCRAWTDTTKQVTQPGEIIVVADSRISVPLDTDVLETDRVLSVTDRTDASVLPGPMEIQAIAPFTDHLELLVQQSR